MSGPFCIYNFFPSRIALTGLRSLHTNKPRNIFQCAGDVFAVPREQEVDDVDGKYFVKTNEGDEHLVTIAGSSVALTLYPGVTGTLTYNSPWNGMMSYDVLASGVLTGASGVAMATGTGVYTSVSNTDPARFAVGFKYQ